MKSIKAPEGGVYRQEFYKCNKERCKKCRDGPGHGPYWSRYWWEDGRTRKEYIGKNPPLTKDTGEEGPPLTKDEPLPKISKPLTKDRLTKDKLTKDKLTKDKTSLPKTRQRASPKTAEGTVEKALAAILDFHSRGIEPLVQDIAAIVGMESRPLGVCMSGIGVQAVKCHRGGVQGRRYVFELREKIEELIALGDSKNKSQRNPPKRGLMP